jgi:hypothetical protein
MISENFLNASRRRKSLDMPYIVEKIIESTSAAIGKCAQPRELDR